MIISKIAFRNIFRHKKRSLLTGLMMAGGCFLFAVFIGMIDGGYGLLIDMFTRDHTGHIQIHKKGYLDKPTIYKIIKNPESIAHLIEGVPSVESWAPRVRTPALAFAGTKTSGIQLMGIDPVLEVKTTRIKEKVDKGRFLSKEPLNEIIISERLARVLLVDIGDEIALIAQGIDGSIANDLFTVVGITESKGASYGSTICYVHIEAARRFLSMHGGVHEIVIVLTDQEKTLRTADVIRKLINDPELSVEPWQVVESQFYRAMQADIKGNWISMFVFTLIIAIGVLNTVLMVILERTREFGVLRAVGTRPSQIFIMIVMETVYLSLMSIVVGIICGVIANWILSVHGIVLSNPIEWGGFLFDTITAKVTVRSIIIPAAVIIATAILVSIPPGIRAARIIPVKALRSA
jgi:putative ABC transport system permease protein